MRLQSVNTAHGTELLIVMWLVIREDGEDTSKILEPNLTMPITPAPYKRKGPRTTYDSGPEPWLHRNNVSLQVAVDEEMMLRGKWLGEGTGRWKSL